MKNRRMKRSLSLTLAILLLLAVCPAPVFAEGYSTAAGVTCPACGLANAAILWSAWTEIPENTVAEDLHLQLTRDVALTEQITVTGNLLLDLNGCTLSAAEKQRCFDVQGGTLTLIDSSAAQQGTLVGGDVSANGGEGDAHVGGTIRVQNEGTLNILGGIVRGGNAVQGGNLFCAKGTKLNISGGTVRDGYAVSIDSSTGRGGNIYTCAATTIGGNARILNGYAQYMTGNSGRGGNLFIHNRAEVVIGGSAIIAGGYAGYRGGNILVNYHSVLTIRDDAQIYGGTARKCSNNLDVMTATLNMEGGTIYGSPAGGCDSNIYVYSTQSVFNFTGGRIYGKINALVGMTINISGKPYIEHLYLPGTNEEKALIIPGKFEEGAWVGLEVQAEDRTFTGPLTDFGSYMYFFHYDKQGLTWYHRKTDNSLYLTTGTPCACCGEDVNDIQWITLESFEMLEGVTLTPGHYILSRNEYVDEWMDPVNPLVIDGVDGYVTLNLNGFTFTGSGISKTFDILPGSTFNVTDNWMKDYHDGVSADYATQGVLTGNLNRAMEIRGEGTQVNIYGGIITGMLSGDNNYGGSLYVSERAELNIYGGAVADGKAEDHGGNIFANDGATVNLYGGEITGGTVTGGTNADGAAFTGNGGNIYITGRYTTLNIYGGAITDGKNLVSTGGNIHINSGANGYMYDGVVENGGAKKYGANIYVSGSTGSGDDIKYSQFFMYGGSFGAVNKEVANISGISRGTANHRLEIYNGTVYTDQSVDNFIADCACYRAEEGVTYVWNYGHSEKTCDITCAMEEAWGKGSVKSLNTGSHDYMVNAGADACFCTICGYTFSQDNIVAVSGGKVYETLAAALARAEADSVITLLGDAEETELTVINNVTLNLNGKKLIADALTVVSGNVVDSTGGKGLLVANSLALPENNAHLPVTTAEGLRFASLTPEQTLERLDNDTVRVRFYFRERSNQTILDNLINEGNREITVGLHLTWTDKDGKAQDKHYVCDHALLQKYAEKWNGRRYVATITGVADTKDLKCTVELSSSAAGGITVAATTLNNVAPINQKLTWDAINSYPLKRKDMTVEEMRQAVVDFMYFTKTYLWTPDETVNYLKNAGGSKDTMSQGTIYGGLPYVGVASGNVYRMMDYIDPETGLLDMKKAIPALANGSNVTMSDLKYFGSQCSIAVYWAWGRVMNSTKYTWTYSVVPKNDFVILGNIKIRDVDQWSAAYNTDVACAENGRQTMYGGYAQLQKADGLVYYVKTSGGNGAGHLVMAYTDAVVVRKADGTIDGDKSYVYLIDQAQKWTEATNAAGDTFQHKTGVGEKYTFKKLYDTGYIPFTFKEFLGEAAIADTEVHLVKNEETLIWGTIRESDRAYETSVTTDTLAWSDLFSSRIRSNYGIADVYLMMYNESGEEFYRHAVRTGTAGNKNLAMAETGPETTIWQLARVYKNRTYHAKIEVQLATGERVVIFDGTITT